VAKAELEKFTANSFHKNSGKVFKNLIAYFSGALALKYKGANFLTNIAYSFML
jgi:hypothetical protein